MPNETRLRRSQLGIPGNESQLVGEAIESPVDVVFIDLEDSLAPSEKTAARSALIETVRAHDWSDTGLGYRINGTDTRWWYEDVIDVVEAVGGVVDTMIVPKVEGPADIRTVATLLAAVETNAGSEIGSIGISAQIETATGMNAVREIAHASDRLEALVFGPADYAASIGAAHGVDDYPGHYWHYPLSRVSQAAASAGLLAIGGPHTDPYDTQGFQAACQAEAALGFDGKLIVHPDQIETVNRVFSPTDAEADRARRIVETYESTPSNDVAAIDGKIIDQEMYRMAKRISAKAEQSGQL
ncbi:HpcH/HpaI aldolase/citrate lyase family protein [Halohasta salina]|uniref:HpcH/HpaI aldolase/citrate lyase family protein n=1 Tax=Halohasta salina TaxID=2961621 RepID=UPI0020A48C5F|nr:CoA ester lyase [Halohasta salina]